MPDPLFPKAFGIPLDGEDATALAAVVACARGLPSLAGEGPGMGSERIYK